MISAVIRTFNSEPTLRKVLTSLRIQDTAVEEIVIVDSGSTDNTLAISKSFNCKVVHYPKGQLFNYSLALNIGVEAASHEKILILSSHTILLFKDLVGRMAKAIDENQAIGSWCNYTRSQGEARQLRRQTNRGALYRIDSNSFNGINGLSNSCSMIEKSAWCEKSFNEKILACEDQEWAYWHYRHTNRPTMYLKAAGVLNLNTNHNFDKILRDTIITSTQIYPPLSTPRSIAKRVKRAIKDLIAGKFKEAREEATIAWYVAITKKQFLDYE